MVNDTVPCTSKFSTKANLMLNVLSTKSKIRHKETLRTIGYVYYHDRGDDITYVQTHQIVLNNCSNSYINYVSIKLLKK